MKRILAGPHAVGEALKQPKPRLHAVYLLESKGKGEALQELRRKAERARIPWEAVPPETMDRLAGGLRHQGVLAVAGNYSYQTLESLLERAQEQPLFVALDQITDPHNFGAVLRSAVAFGVDGVITLKDRAAPVSGVVVRASAGASELAPVAQVTNLARTLAMLQREGLEVVGLDGEGGQDLATLPYPDRGRVLVLGSEGRGLRRLVRESCDTLARVPMAGPIASLNASVAAGIAIYLSARARS